VFRRFLYDQARAIGVEPRGMCSQVLFHGGADWSRLQFLASQAGRGRAEQLSQAAADMRSYARSTECRRKWLLRYLGDEADGTCSTPCDVCANAARSLRVGGEARALLLCARACGGRFGSGVLLEFVRGAKTARLAAKGRLLASEHYGSGARFNRAAEWWRKLLDALLERALLSEQLVEWRGGGAAVPSFRAVCLTADGDSLVRAGTDEQPAPLSLVLVGEHEKAAPCRHPAPGCRAGPSSSSRQPPAAPNACDGSAPQADQIEATAAETRLLEVLRALPAAEQLAADADESHAGVHDADGAGGAPLGELLDARQLLAIVKARPSNGEALRDVAPLAVTKLGGVGSPRCTQLLRVLRAESAALQLQLDQFSHKQHTARLLRRLLTCRATVAERADVAPYMILGEAVLNRLAAHRPTSLGELRGMPGVPQRSADLYGMAFMETVQQYVGAHNLSLSDHGRLSSDRMPAAATSEWRSACRDGSDLAQPASSAVSQPAVRELQRALVTPHSVSLPLSCPGRAAGQVVTTNAGGWATKRQLPASFFAGRGRGKQKKGR